MNINNVAPSQFSMPPTAGSNSSDGRIGAQISNIEGTLNAISLPASEASVTVDRILTQLAVYTILPKEVRTRLWDLLKSCQPDEKKAVWVRGLKSCSRMECIQLFIDCELAHEVINCSDSAGHHAVMSAVQEKDCKMLNLLLTIETADLNKPFPSLDGDTLLIRSVKNGDMEIFNLLVDHPHVDVYERDGDNYTARDNAWFLDQKFMHCRLFSREVQVAHLRYAEDHSD